MSKADLTKSVAKDEEGKGTKERKPLPPFNATKKNGKGSFSGTIVVDLRQHRIPHVQMFSDPLDWVRTTIASLSPIRDELAGLKTSVERRKHWKDLDSLVRAKKAAENLGLADLTSVVVGKISGGEMTKEEIDAMLERLNAAKAAMVK